MLQQGKVRFRGKQILTKGPQVRWKQEKCESIKWPWWLFYPANHYPPQKLLPANRFLSYFWKTDRSSLLHSNQPRSHRGTLCALPLLPRAVLFVLLTHWGNDFDELFSQITFLIHKHTAFSPCNYSTFLYFELHLPSASPITQMIQILLNLVKLFDWICSLSTTKIIRKPECDTASPK